MPGGVVNVCVVTGGGVELAPPPPQPMRATTGKHAKSRAQARMREESRRRGVSSRATGTRNVSPMLASLAPSTTREAVLTTWVLTVTVKVAFAPEDTLRLDGEMVQVAFVGIPPQESVTVPAAPGVAAIDKL